MGLTGNPIVPSSRRVLSWLEFEGPSTKNGRRVRDLTFIDRCCDQTGGVLERPPKGTEGTWGHPTRRGEARLGRRPLGGLPSSTCRLRDAGRLRQQPPNGYPLPRGLRQPAPTSLRCFGTRWPISQLEGPRVCVRRDPIDPRRPRFQNDERFCQRATALVRGMDRRPEWHSYGSSGHGDQRARAIWPHAAKACSDHLRTR